MKLSRLELIVTLALAAPLVAEAQPAGKIARIGYLSGGFSSQGQSWREVFREALRGRGWVEGQKLSA